MNKHGPISPAVINELFLEKLPDSLGDKQKRSKIRNLTYDLAHRRGVIKNIGDHRGSGARWVIHEMVRFLGQVAVKLQGVLLL